MKRPIPARTKLAAKEIGENLRTWRKLRNITAAELADSASVTRETIYRMEKGDPSISLSTIINVCNRLSITELLIQARDPYETDYGRARADQALPKRVRNSKNRSI